jgi:hypothetical protein
MWMNSWLLVLATITNQLSKTQFKTLTCWCKLTLLVKVASRPKKGVQFEFEKYFDPSNGICMNSYQASTHNIHANLVFGNLNFVHLCNPTWYKCFLKIMLASSPILRKVMSLSNLNLPPLLCQLVVEGINHFLGTFHVYTQDDSIMW